MPGLAVRPARLVVGLALGCMGLSTWISNSGAAAIVFPMALTVGSETARQRSHACGRAVRPEERPQSQGILLAMAFRASIGGMATSVRPPRNLLRLALLRQQTELTLSFFQWLARALPVTLILGGIMGYLLHLGGSAMAGRTRMADGSLVGRSPSPIGTVDPRQSAGVDGFWPDGNLVDSARVGDSGLLK